MTTAAPAARPVETWLRRYSTQATAALAVVVGVTGVMMFFHLAKAEVEAMHEWLGMAFAAAAILHAVRHRASLGNMLGQTRMRVLFAAAAVAAAAFVVLAPPKQANPFRQATQLMLQAPIAQLAPVVGMPAEALAARLGTTDHGQSIDAIAKVRGTDPVGLLATTLQK